MMSTSTCRQQQDMTVSSTGFPYNKDKKDILRKIEQKLETITLHRQNHAKSQLREELTRKITTLQINYSEQIKAIEEKVRQLRQQLSEVRVRQGEHCKKTQLSRRMRRASILQLQKKVQNLSLLESKERKEIEYRLISMVEEKTEKLLQQVQTQKQNRIQHVNGMQDSLQETLPALNFAITATSAHLGQQVGSVHKQIMTSLAFNKEGVERKEKEREVEKRKIMKLISEVASEMKQQLAEERRARQANKQKLLAVFTSAYKQLTSS